jgi:hypothetical protein
MQLYERIVISKTHRRNTVRAEFNMMIYAKTNTY